ncbi:MAG TPA: hypothetical protein VGV57_13015 [Thermoleophilaceae bacterium]|nr:hypothetical protein [Thermoleophilaceae bacterium]
MLARVATFDKLPEDLNDEAVERLRQIARETPATTRATTGATLKAGGGYRC